MAKPLRILMVVRLFYPWVGGAERQAHQLAQKLAEKDIAVELVTGWWFWKTPQSETIDGIAVYRNHTLWNFFGIRGLRKLGGYLYILTLLRHLYRRRKTYDLIHVHGLNYHTFTAVLAGRWFGRKTLTKLVNSGMASDIKKMHHNKLLPLTRYMLPTALRCDCFVALNSTIVQELDAANVPRQNIIALPNGVKTDHITAKPDYTLHDPIRIIYVGRLHEQKGVDVLLRAFQELVRKYSTHRFCLQLLGTGPLKNQLHDLATVLGIASQVEFRGQTNQVLEHLQQADIFVLPSRAEGISNALLEAMASGLPVVVSDVPGNTDVIEHIENGLLFNLDDPDSLTDNLILLLKQPGLRERLGANARRTVEDNFDLNYIADRYVSLYQQLLAVKDEVAYEDLSVKMQ